MKASDVTAIIVTYNSAAVLGACLDSLPQDLAVLIVDNQSTDNTHEIAKKHRPDAQWIEAGGNLGYGTAANIGLRLVQTPFAFVMNPDVIVEPHTLSELIEAAQRHPKAAMLGPKVMVPGGGFSQPNAHRFHPDNPIFPFPWRNNVKKIRRFFGLSPTRWKFDPDRDNSVGWIVGCTLFLVMDRMRQVITVNDKGQDCWFDENFFLYFDEDDLALRILETDQEIYWIPRAVVTHFEGSSSGEATPEAKEFRSHWMRVSRRYMGDKYKGRYHYHPFARWWWEVRKSRYSEPKYD